MSGLSLEYAPKPKRTSADHSEFMGSRHRCPLFVADDKTSKQTCGPTRLRHRLDARQRRHQIAKLRPPNFKIAVLVERGAGRRQQHHGIGKAGSLSIARGIGHRDVERYGAFDP